MRKIQRKPSQIRNQSITALADSNTQIEIEVDNCKKVSIKTLLQWLKQNGGRILAEAKFKTGPKAQQIWKEAFPNYDSRNRLFETDFNLSCHTESGRKQSVSASVYKITVKLTDGTYKDNIFYITLNKRAGTPDKAVIMKQN